MSSGSPRPRAEGEVLRGEQVVVKFGSKTVLDRMSLSLEAGENVAILGGSGTGKSVFLKLVVGLLAPNEGSIHLWGQPTEGLDEDAWTPFRRRMGMVFQSGALFDSMSVFENIAFPLRQWGDRDEDAITKRVEECLTWVDLDGVGHQSPSELSGGMRRRVALARTISFEPEFVLYDEPTTGLDPVTARKISRLIRDLDRKLSSTSILVTHDIECARTVASRWAYLAGGKIVADGTPDELLSSGDEELREFLLGGDPARELPLGRKGQ